MATSIEQIFRSYVVTKFREIQEQQYGGGKVGSQQNGEIDSSEQVSPSDDEIVTIGNLQNDPLVQKIEQVLSEVLGTESQYKPDDGEDTAKSKSRSTKRGLSDEVEVDVEVEVPRKKSKKDKKHKDKKKKKKRKKEKKYKKQSKESKLNDEHKEFGGSVPDSKAEKLNFLSSEDVDLGFVSPLKQGSEWFMEKNSRENLNSTMSNSCDAFSSENSKLDTSEEDSVSINIQELTEIKLTNEKENEQHTDLTVHPYSEDESLNTVVVESGVCMDNVEVASAAEIKPPETSSGSKAEEKVPAPEKSPESTGHEIEHLGTSLEPGTVKIADLNASRNLEFSHPETIQQSVPILADKSDCKFMKLPLESVVEAKDSVTTLGFLAMVVGKDFEATSEFLNTAKVKASERSPKDSTFLDRKDPSSEKDSDVTVTEKRLLEETSEPLRAVNEDDFEPSLGHKHQRNVWKRFPESDARKRTEATLYPDALKETQASAITMEFKKSSPSLLILNKMDSGEPLSDPTAEVKNLKAASVFKEMDTRCLKAKSESENLQAVPHTLRKVDVRNQDRSPEFEKKIQWSYLEKPLETVMEEWKSYAVAKDTETVAKLKASERFSRSGTAPEINDVKTTPGTPDILKTQYQEVSKYASETAVESETLTKQKRLEKLPEPLLMVKNVQSISESQYVKEIKNMNNVFQSEVVAQRKDSEISGVLEERDSDAASGSLHMIFTNYSEPNLENDAESEAMMELKTLESVPELPSMVDANKSKELPAKEIKDLKSVESEAIIKLTDLENKLKSLHRDVKNLEMPTVINFQTLVASEATSHRKSNETVSHSVSEIEKVSDTIKYMEKDQTVAEAAGFKILPERLKITENEPSSKTEGLLFSKSLEEKDVVSSEATPELGAIAMIQKLKEAVDFTAGLDVSSAKKIVVLETTVSPDSQEPSTTVNIAKDFASVSECPAKQSPAPFHTVKDNKTKGTEVILDSLYDLQVKYPATTSEFLLSSELGSLGKKQKLKERAETARSRAAPEPLYASFIVPESDEFNKVVNTEPGPESSYLAKTNSENVLKSVHMVEVKDSKSHLGSTYIDVKDVEMESETTPKERVEIVGDLPECKSVVTSEILEITSDSPKKIEMLLKPQCPPVLHASNAAFAIMDLEANSKTVHIINIENLEAPSECEEAEVVKTAEIVPTSLFAVEMDSVSTPTSGHIVEDKESKTIKTVVNLKASRDSMDILEETFEPTCITNVKETNQNLKTNLDYLIKEEINNTYTKPTHEMDASGSQTIQRCMPDLRIHISEGLPTAVDNTIKKSSGTDLRPETQSVVSYSESVCPPVNVLEREDYDTALVLMEIKDSGARSSFLDTRKTTPQLKTIPQHLCEFKSRDSADAGEAASTSETKGLGRALNSTSELEVQHTVASGTHLNTTDLKSSGSVLEATVSEGIVEVKTAPTYLGAANVFQSPGTTTESHSSETGTEYLLKAYDYNAASESESGKVKVSENVEIVATSKDAQEIKGMKSPQSLSTIEVRNLEKSVIFEEVPDVSETSQQFSGNAEIKVLKVITPSGIAESVKDSEKQLKLQLHLKEKCSKTLEPGYSILYSEPQKSDANSGFIGTVVLKDTERPVKSTHAVESVHSKTAKDFQATPKSGSVGEINVLQVQTSARKEQGLDLEGISKSTVTLDRHDLERNLLSVIVSEEKTPEGSLESSHGVKAKDSEVLKCKNGKDVDVLKQNMAEMKNLESAPEWDALLQAKTSEIIPIITSEMKDSEAILEPLCMTQEKDLGGTPHISLEEQVLKATPKAVCTGAESNLQANQQLTAELKDSQAAAETLCMAEKMNLEVGKLVTVEVKGSETSLESVRTATEKDLEATPDVLLKDQDSQATPQTSDIKEKNEGSILKDKKSEKVSSKSKDKSKSGKRAKKSRSKSPSKSKKRKKKSRSHSTSRRVTSRRGRSRSRDDSDSRKKHSSSRHKSRSKSVDKKDSKESSLRSRRRRSRTSDRHKSRSRSVEKIKSRWRRSRSSDHRKSRSRSIDKSTRRKLRLSRSSEKHKSRSKSVDRMETRSRRRRSRSSDHRKSRSQSVDKRDTSVRTRRRRSRSSDRSRSIDKRDTSARRRRRRSRTSDNFKSRSKSLDRRESSLRSRRRRSRSSDRRKSRSRSVDDKRDTSLRTRRKRSRSLDNRKSRSRSADKETSVRTRRRRSRSSDIRRSKSKSVDKRESSVRTRRKRSRSLDNRKTRSKSVDKRDSSIRARRRRSRSSDNRKSRSRSAGKQETSVRTRRKRSRSSDNRKSRSRSLNKGDTSVRTRRKRSRSSDHLKSRSRSVDKRETSVRTRRRQSRSSDTHKSRSKSVDKREASVKTRQRRSRSLDKRKSRSKTPDKRDTSIRTKRRQSHSSDTRKSRSKSLDKKDTSAKSKRKRSRSCDSQKSRSKSVDKTETLTRSKRQRSQSPDQKSRTTPDEKDEPSLMSKSSDRQRSKSKSRSKSSDRRQDKDTSDSLREKHSKSRSKSPEKIEGSESLETPVCDRTKSPEHQKSKSRSRSKSLEKTKKERSRRSKSKGSKSPELKTRKHGTDSRSRRNRSRSLTRKRTSRSKSDNRSRTRSRTRSRSCTRRWRRTRSRSASRQRSLSKDRRRRSRRNRSRSTERRRRRSDSRDSFRVSLRLRSRSRTPARLRCSTGRRRSASKSPDHRRSRTSSRSPKRLTELDKAQLLEIAKANAAAMCAKAGVPLPPSLMPALAPEKKEEKVVQKTAKETIMELTEKCKKIAQSQEDDVILNKPHVSDEEEEENPFINHPFKLNEPKPIFFNLGTPSIKPAPPKNQVTLTKEFPVSSGSQHRKKEADSAYGEWVPVEKNKDENTDDVFPNPASLEPVDISSALNERTVAQKRLTENTFDLEAMCLLNRAQERIDAWAQLNSLPGQFTGSTGAQVLTSEQLSNSGPQAWIKKDQFLRAAPVSGGMGAQLMRKMGWREGEGLGKNKEGNREPILVDFKTDRKGLVAVGEKTKRHGLFSAVKDLSGKHPVSLLVEACNKRRWSPPVFVLVHDNGPEHRKHFVFKVMVNGVEHKPTNPSPNKKHAKAAAATVALQALGILPKELMANATSFRSASRI